MVLSKVRCGGVLVCDGVDRVEWDRDRNREDSALVEPSRLPSAVVARDEVVVVGYAVVGALRRSLVLDVVGDVCGAEFGLSVCVLWAELLVGARKGRKQSTYDIRVDTCSSQHGVHERTYCSTE